MELESQSLEWQAMQIKGLMMKPICLAILFAFMALRPAQAAPCGPQYSQPCTETDTAATQVEKRQGKWGQTILNGPRVFVTVRPKNNFLSMATQPLAKI